MNGGGKKDSTSDAGGNQVFSPKKKQRTAAITSGGSSSPFAAGNTAKREKELPSGGAYKDVAAFDKIVHDGEISFRREADHTPPKSTYKGTPFEWLSEDYMPAVSIEKDMHRKGVSTTGSYGDAVQYREKTIKGYLIKGNFMMAMIEAFKDQKNAAVHSLYYAISQAGAARYAHGMKLLTDAQLDVVLKYIQTETYPPPAYRTTPQNALAAVTTAEQAKVDRFLKSRSGSRKRKLTEVSNPFADSSASGGQAKHKPVDPGESDPLAGGLTPSQAGRLKSSLSGSGTSSADRDLPFPGSPRKSAKRKFSMPTASDDLPFPGSSR